MFDEILQWTHQLLQRKSSGDGYFTSDKSFIALYRSLNNFFSQRRYLLGVFGDNNVVWYFQTNKMVLVIKGLAWLQHLLLWPPCARWYSVQCRGILWHVRTKINKLRKGEYNKCKPSTIRLTTTIHLTPKMTSAQVVETSVTTTDNSPSQDYAHPDDQIALLYDWEWQATFENIQTRYLWGLRIICTLT